MILDVRQDFVCSIICMFENMKVFFPVNSKTIQFNHCKYVRVERRPNKL